MSLPAWECGLKYKIQLQKSYIFGHSLRGSVDWNMFPWIFPKINIVTPCVGVWIEIRERIRGIGKDGVTPCVGVWIEIEEYPKICNRLICHSLRGSVDWNFFYCVPDWIAKNVTPCVGVWIEMTNVLDFVLQCTVTPCVGVWIEMQDLRIDRLDNAVTPCVGVWIEIFGKDLLMIDTEVTPCVGVWIEILAAFNFSSCLAVTPCVGVWIEIGVVIIHF